MEEVSDAELEALTDTEHPQGVVAVIEPRSWSLADIRLPPGMTCAGARRGAGSGQRRHHAPHRAGARAPRGVVALKGTADLTNPKVIRGGMGAASGCRRLPPTPEELVAWARLQRAEIWVADVAGESRWPVPRRTSRDPRSLLVVGQRRRRRQSALDAAADRRVGDSAGARSGVAQRGGRRRHPPV